jgi:hypothetical protein
MNGPIRGESIIAAVVSTLVATGLAFWQASAQRKHERKENESQRRHEDFHARSQREHELNMALIMQPGVLQVEPTTEKAEESNEAPNSEPESDN